MQKTPKIFNKMKKHQCTGVTAKGRRCKNMTKDFLCYAHTSSLHVCDKYAYVYTHERSMGNKNEKWLNEEWLDEQDKQMCIPTLRIAKYKWKRSHSLGGFCSSDTKYLRPEMYELIKRAPNSYCLISGAWQVENKRIGQKDLQQSQSKRLMKTLPFGMRKVPHIGRA